MRKLRVEEVKLLAQGQSFKAQSLDRCFQMVLEPECWPLLDAVCLFHSVLGRITQTNRSLIHSGSLLISFQQNFSTRIY